MGYIGTRPTAAPLTSSQLDDGIVTAAKLATDAVETAKVKDLNISTGKLAASAVTQAKTDFIATSSTGAIVAKGTASDTDGYITLNCDQNTHGVKIKSPPHSAAQTYTLTLPQSITNTYFLQTDGSGNLSFADVPGETKPTVASISPSTIDNTASDVTITGTNYVSGCTVEFQSTTGSIISPNTTAFTDATTLAVNVTLATDETWFIRVENPDGLAGRSSSAILTTSDAPVWTTTAGDLGSFSGGTTGALVTVAATGDTVVITETTDVLTNAAMANCQLATSGAITSSGGFPAASYTSQTTFTFTLRATDAQAQTADREFTMTATYEMLNGAQFN